MVCVVRNSRLKLSQGQIFWREAGQGEAIIFIHGECRDSAQWLDFFEVFSPEFHCFAPDLLGFGDSERPKVPYSIQWESEVLHELLETLRLKKVYLVGDSLGAWIATRYAMNHPDRVKGLILRSPLGVDTNNNRSYFWEKCLVSRLPIVPWFLKLLMPFGAILGFKNKLQNASTHRKKLRRSPGTCRLLFRSGTRLRSEYLNFQLAHFTIPTLILSRPTDDKIALSQAQTYAALVQTSEFKGQQTQDEAIATIRDWLLAQS